MKIFYTGIGSNDSGEHTIQEFVNIMYCQFTSRYWTENELEYYYTVPALNFKRFKLPEEFIYFNLHDWIEYSGSSVLYTGNNEICNECGKRLIIQNGECVNCEYIRYINTHYNQIFDPEYSLEYSESCEE